VTSPDDVRLRQDMHVHSTFSDGRDSIADNVAEAEALGLRALGCVDHVRADSDWVADYVAEARRVGAQTAVALTCAVEAKLLDAAGTLDTPPGLAGVDAVYAADHQVPMGDGPNHPRVVGEKIAGGELRAQDVIEAIVAATAGCLDRPEPIVIAHLFSVLPKVGLDESDVPVTLLEELAETAARSNSRVEISERWRCPSARTLIAFAQRDVEILLSTDSHKRDTIGRYTYCATVLAELDAAAGGG
jgi:putative hydrolase